MEHLASLDKQQLPEVEVELATRGHDRQRVAFCVC